MNICFTSTIGIYWQYGKMGKTNTGSTWENKENVQSKWRKTKQSSKRLHAHTTKVFTGTQTSRQDLSYNNSFCGHIRLQRSWAGLWHYAIVKTDNHIMEEHFASMFRIQGITMTMQLDYVGNMHGRCFNHIHERGWRNRTQSRPTGTMNRKSEA